MKEGSKRLRVNMTIAIALIVAVIGTLVLVNQRPSLASQCGETKDWRQAQCIEAAEQCESEIDLWTDMGMYPSSCQGFDSYRSN